MSTSDIQPILEFLKQYSPFILPHLWKGIAKASEAASAEIGKDAWDKIKETVNKLRSKIKKEPKGKEILESVAKNPENEAQNEVLFRLLERMLLADQKLTAELLKVIKIEHPQGTNFDLSNNQGKIKIGDITVTVYPMNMAELEKTLKRALPQDSTPDHLLKNLRTFGIIHEQLGEWKHVHNYLNEALVAMDIFLPGIQPRKSILSSLMPSSEDEFDMLGREWRQVKRHIDGLEFWAGKIKTIGKKMRVTQQGQEGEPWAVEVVVAAREVNDSMILPTFKFKRKFIIELSNILYSKISYHMTYADKKILEIATQLQTISQFAFGKMK